MKSITVIGLGRVGLPLALYLGSKGYTVYGVDIDQKRIAELQRGSLPFREEGAEIILKKNLNRLFFPTRSYSVIAKSAVIIVTIGTPVDDNMNPDYTQLDSALSSSVRHLKKNQLLILRSTLPPQGTISVKHTIEHHTKLTIGRDLFLAYCPERIAEGKSLRELDEIPQIIGGVDRKSTSEANTFFTELGMKTLLTDSTSAELAKLYSNMYRYISFAIANEFLVISENFGKNAHEIINLVNKDYKRGGLALPGFTGGPCLYKDGFFLVNQAPFIDLIATSWKINESMPLFLVQKIKEKTQIPGKRIVILGTAFKPEIDDMRQSLSLKLRNILIQEGGKVILHDPYVTHYEKQHIEKNLKKALQNTQIVILATRHNLYRRQKDMIVSSLKKQALIADIWNEFEMNQFIFPAQKLKGAHARS